MRRRSRVSGTEGVRTIVVAVSDARLKGFVVSIRFGVILKK